MAAAREINQDKAAMLEWSARLGWPMTVGEKCGHDDYVLTVFDNFSASVVVDENTVNLELCHTEGQDDYNILRH